MEKLVFLVFLLTFSSSLGLDLWSGVFGSADKDGAEDAGIVDTLKRALYDGSGEAEGQYPEEVVNYIKASTDPEVNMGPKELIEYWGYPAEEYEVVTSDGYLLTVQRITGSRHASCEGCVLPTNGKKPVVFLLHGVLGAATNWLTNLPNQSLGYLLADKGFDVWLGSVRGTTYSKKHVQFKSTDKAYWDYSFQEIATFDVPAMVDFALATSGQKQLYYVAHSQGTQVMFAKASEDQEFAKKIKIFLALGPVTTVGHITSPVRYLAKIGGLLDVLFKLFGVRQFLPNDIYIDALSKAFCNAPLLQRYVCSNILFLYAGFDGTEMNMTRLPVYMAHTPAGTSVKNMIHMGQLVQNGKFQKYDHGFIMNMIRYGSTSPPQYNLKNMKIPTALFWGDNDVLADPADVNLMIPQVPNIIFKSHSNHFDHLDYIWGLTAKEEVYDPLIEILIKDLAKK